MQSLGFDTGVSETPIIPVMCGESLLAKKLSDAGKSVLVLDHRSEIGDKLCTGIVGSELYNHYPEVKKFIYSEANSAKIFNNSEHIIDIKKDETQALIIDRVKFIQSIINNAKRSGATLKKQRLVTSSEVGKEYVKVSAKFGNKEEIVIKLNE